MIETSAMEAMIKQCGIIMEAAPLPDSILGYYNCSDEYYIILINSKIESNSKLYRCVLAEELGHYRTTIGDITPRKYMCYMDRLSIDRGEQAALKWATSFLIPTELLLEVIMSNAIVSLYELAELFEVTIEFLIHKFEFMARKSPVWNIDDNRCLCLNKLPSVLIYEKF